MDPDEYRRTSLANWTRMTAGWERRRPDMENVSAPVREWLVWELAPQPGATILEPLPAPETLGSPRPHSSVGRAG